MGPELQSLAVTSDPNRRSGSQDVSDAHTDPLLPRITDEMLAAGGSAPASALDDRMLAELLAELEDDDQYALDELLDGEEEPLPKARTARPVDRQAEVKAVSTEDLGPVPAPRPETPARDDQVANDEPAADDEPAPDVGPVANHEPAAPTAKPEPGAQRPSFQAGPPSRRTAQEAVPVHLEPPQRAKEDFLDEDDSYPVIRQSPLGPVVHSRYGDFRPPVEREPEAQTLTGFGLTRRSRSKVGSILFTVVFVAIFLLILLQAVVSLISTPGH